MFFGHLDQSTEHPHKLLDHVVKELRLLEAPRRSIMKASFSDVNPLRGFHLPAKRQVLNEAANYTVLLLSVKS